MNQTDIENAMAKLEYVERMKDCASRWALRTSATSRCLMFIPPSEIEHTTLCIREIIDDLFHTETAAARKIIEAHEREDARAAVREWTT